MSSVRLQRLVPMLPVRSMPASVEFYEKLLGFSVETRLCDCRLMVDQSLNVQPDAPRQTILYLYPDDVVKYHEQVRRNGLPAPDLRVTFYGMKEFRIRDPDGNELWIGQAT